MTRTSTASSSTDAPAATAERDSTLGGTAAAAAGGIAEGATGELANTAAERATRRQFFRLFGRQTAAGAGNVLAGVAALRQTGQEAIDELIGGERPTPAAIPLDDDATPPVPAADALRSPYRVAPNELLILDQRALAERVTQLRCRDASEVASAIRAGAAGAGPVLGQIAAYALALAAEAASARPRQARDARLRAAADTLRAARPISRSLSVAVDRVLAACEAGGDGDPAALARAEADAIAMQAALDHAALGQLAAGVLARIAPSDEAAGSGRLALLMHGDLGPLAGGMVGPGFALIQSLAAVGRPVHAWLTDGAPLMDGRAASWQLEQLDVPNTTIPDAATGWLLGQRRIDAVLLRAEWVAANGDAMVPLGSVALALAARARGVPVYGVAPATVLDAGVPDGAALPAGLLVPSARGAARLDPAAEVIGDELIGGLFTEHGLLAPPYERAVEAAAAREAAARSPITRASS